ncbi:c-type cytochrome domain-containing protein [Chryseolinea sp. T2]|uniref:c-type cytochrome domain-containing protein n=1 Tax=Chryseolinea sp. T2 TaxID=3129255 RepID=UPI003077894E
MLQFRRFTIAFSSFLNVLLLFLIFFEDRVQLPVLLQVSGRMHPLILHFPLTLLFTAIFLEYLSTRPRFRHPSVQGITWCVFYLFALSAATTALFGFFLYEEGTYLGREVTLHKWFGVAVSLLSVAILLVKSRALPATYYVTLGLCAGSLVAAGHFGAEVTHGKGFLTEPLLNRTRTAVQIENADSAVVFRDVIQPIFNEKCLNCHNANRAKGDLILSDYESMMDGGEHRDGLVPGKAEKSLLYKYISLPMEDSLHMPPKDKLQLDREEIRLIGWWINSGADPNVKYVTLPKTDSIQPIMLARFHPKTGLDLLNIPFVDYDEIEGLNNPYRTVQQISATQPYVAVFLGSKKDFTSKDIEELAPVSRQVVSIDLGNSEVKDNDLKNLEPFTHLQKLYLQNTGIGDEGVKHLKEFKYLETLNLSGTKITSQTVEQISKWKDLKKLYLYNTAVPETSLATLKGSHPDLEIFSTAIDLSDSVYNAALTPPVVKIDSSFFRNSALVDVKLSRGKVKYFYTLDGKDPNTESMVYDEAFRIDHSATLRIIATMNGWKDSKVVEFPLMKLGKRPYVIKLESKPDPKHSGKLDSALVDGLSGGFSRGDKEYLGYIDNDFQVLLDMGRDTELSEVTISYLEDGANGAFAPESIELWTGSDKERLSMVASQSSALPSMERAAGKGVIVLKFPRQTARYIRVKAKRFKTLPEWNKNHGKGKPEFFVDEVSLN